MSRPTQSDTRPTSAPDFGTRATVLFAIGLLLLPAYLATGPTGAPTDAEPALGPAAAADAWETLATSDGSHATRRHEAGGVVVGDALYLLGGRGRPPLERWSAADGGWRDLGPAPLELHHFQPVAIDGRIHVVGAFTCCYPNESAVPEIHVFDTTSGTWDLVATLPETRVRGSAAAAAHDGRLYVLGGNTRGHDGGAVPWFDVWDPASDTWTVLPDAPHARDHFAAVVVGDSLVAAGGRTSTLPNPSANPVLATDVYDFRSGVWRTAAPIPTPRGGTVGLGVGGRAIIIGGELNTEPDALDAVEAFDVAGGTWHALPSLREGRHGSGGGVIGGTLHVVAGATSLGGATETHAHETLRLGEPGPEDLEDGPASGGGGAPEEEGGGNGEGSTGDEEGSGATGDRTDTADGNGTAEEIGTEGDAGPDDATGAPAPTPVAGAPSRRGGGLGHGWGLALALVPALALRSRRRTRASVVRT